MDIKDLYPGCTYHHDNTYSVLNNDSEENIDVYLDASDIAAIYECLLFPEQLSPIFLTDEIIIQLGFTKHDVFPLTWIHLESSLIVGRSHRYYYTGREYNDRIVTFSSLYYVHELQLIGKVLGIDFKIGTEKNYDFGNQT